MYSIGGSTRESFLHEFQINLADVWLYCSLEFSNQCIDDWKELTPWVKEFVDKFTSEERVAKYLAERPKRLI